MGNLNFTFIVGPTASGKSDYAMKLALQNDGVIVNCDSVQMYAEVNIGAAKPSLDEMNKVPHYLYGHVKPPLKYTAGDYRRDFFKLIENLKENNINNIYVVGGTGFYFQALEYGMFDLEEGSSLVKEELVKIASTPEGVLSLYEELKRFDPEAAQKIHPNDRYRLIRYSEIVRTSGKRPSQLKAEMVLSQFPYPIKKIGVLWTREELLSRIQLRVQKMIQMGLIEEVMRLCENGLSDWEPLKSVGYKEVLKYLKGEIKNIKELEEQIFISTRQLAKRQMTWFKRDFNIDWIHQTKLS